MNRQILLRVAAFGLLLAFIGLGSAARADRIEATSNVPQATTQNDAGADPPYSVVAAPPKISGQIAGGALPVAQPAPPQWPNVVLHDQYDNISFNYTNSQNYEQAMSIYNDFLADDFIVGPGQTWYVDEVDVAGTVIAGMGPITSFNVSVYTDAGQPGTEIYAATNLGYSVPVAGQYVIPLPNPAVVSAGTYWVMVQANMGYWSGGQFMWYNRGQPQFNRVAAWHNPGDGWGTGCSEMWDVRWRCAGDLTHPEQVWRLLGTAIGPTETATPTSTNTTTPTYTPTATITRTSTPTPQAVMVGHVNWQGHGTQPNAAQIQPFTLTLKSGGTEVGFPGYQVTDASGFFTVNVSTLAQGTYDWRVKGPSFLASAGIVTLSGPVTQVDMGLQRAGDLNGDNLCNTQDFNLLKGNFGQGGAPPIGPGTRSISLGADDSSDAMLSGRRNPQAPVTLVLDDGTMETSVGLNANYRGLPLIAINRFTPDPADFPMVLNQISIQFPDPVRAHLDLTGRAIDLLVYEDPSGSGNPANANKRLQQSVTVQVADGVTFSSYPVNVQLDGPGDVYVGFSNTYDHGGTVVYSYPFPIDQNLLNRRSWVAGNVNGADPDYNDLANNLILSVIDDMGFSWAGNWIIRADAESATGPTTTPTYTRTATRTRTPTSTSTATVTPTSTPQALLVGHVNWQGHGTQPSVQQIQPFTLTLKSGVTEFDFPGYQVTDASGFFTVSVGTLPQGTYDWRVKGPSFLATSGIATLVGGTTQVEMGLQRAGDLNGDNLCNTLDFNLLKGNFGQGGGMVGRR